MLRMNHCRENFNHGEPDELPNRKRLLGEKQLPDTAYYGVQTLRGKENFHITGIPMSTEPYFVKAFGYVKKAAALANRDLGVLDAASPMPLPPLVTA